MPLSVSLEMREPPPGNDTCDGCGHQFKRGDLTTIWKAETWANEDTGKRREHSSQPRINLCRSCRADLKEIL